MPAPPMEVIGDAWYQAIGMGIEVVSKHPFQAGTRLGVPNMTDDTVGNECFPPLVEIQAPRVGGPVGNRGDFPLGGMIAPNPAIDRQAILIGRSRGTQLAIGKDAVAAPKPAIRPPF